MKNTITLLFVFIVTLIIFSGCTDTSKPSDLPPLFPCRVTITQEGKPLAGATVEFIPVEQAKYHALALVGDDGTGQMNTYGHPGSPSGKYKVVVKKIVDDDFVYDKINSSGEREVSEWNTYKMVEDKYSSAETTPHEIEITGKGKTERTFDVGKAVKIKMNNQMNNQ